MAHEINQFDIPNHQLLDGRDQPKASIWTDIGEAKVTQTIFGRAKVCVTCAQDKNRRAWLLATLLMILLAALAWQGWVVSQQTEPSPEPIPLSARIRVSPPVSQPEYIAPTTPSIEKKMLGVPSQLETFGLTTRREPPPQTPGLRPSEKMAAKPAATNPAPTNKPMPIATDNNASKMQPQLSSPIQATPPIVNTPPASQSVTDTHTVAPATTAPLVGESTPQPALADDNPSSPPGDAQLQ